MQLKTLLASALAALGMAAPAFAVPVEIDFEAPGSVSGGSGGFSGTIFGLDNEDGSYTPSAILLDIRGRVQYSLTSEFQGEITFAAGQVVDAFISQRDSVFGDAPLFPGRTFVLSDLAIGLEDPERQLFEFFFVETVDGPGTQFSGLPEFSIRELAVPLPSSAILLLTGLGCLLSFCRRAVATRRDLRLQH